MRKNVVVVGGGMAGLAAAIYLARGGRTVTVFEKRRYLGGRAVTHLRHGYRFNLGPHAFYRAGVGAQVLRELGIPVRGGRPDGNGVALRGGEEFRFPGNFWSILTTGLLNTNEKAELMRHLIGILRMKKFDRFRSISARTWLDQTVSGERVRQLLEALMRLETYCADAESQSAASVLNQMRIAMKGVTYVDEGWQKIIDAMHGAAVAAGVNFITSSRVVSIDHDGHVRGIELGGLEEEVEKDTVSAVAIPDMSAPPTEGTRLPADTIVLAVEPSSAREIVGDALQWPALTPVVASCLDVALSSLPKPENAFALGIDTPLYLSVHSKWSHLTPKGAALIQTARYGGGQRRQDLEELLDRLQPGWREVLVHQRFLPAMTVSYATLPPGEGPARPHPVTSIKGLYLAGDWVGEEGLLSDASLASARVAARAILTAS
jgi:phytoene dehydrogenase-like protein